MNETLQKKSPEKKLIFFAKLSFSFFTPQRVKTKNGFWIHDVGNRTNIGGCSCRNIRSLETVMHIPFVLCDAFTVLAQSLKGYSTHLTIIATHATYSNRQVD